MIPRAVGTGAGHEDFEHYPNVLRLIWGNITQQTQCSGASVAGGAARDGSESNFDTKKVSDFHSGEGKEKC
jgi:hypothetical protein